MQKDARVEALQRLETAQVEEDRLGERYRSAVGTSSELPAYARLRVATDVVAAREAWLKSVDDGGADGRVWVNGREVGGAGSMFLGLETSHD